MARSPAIEKLILKRLLLTFPEAKALLVSFALNDGPLDSMPDLTVRDQAEKIAETERELSHA